MCIWCFYAIIRFLRFILACIDKPVEKYLKFRNLVPIQWRGGDIEHKWHHRSGYYPKYWYR